jgi:hypothetical protein
MNNRRTGIFDFLNEGSSGSSSGGSSSSGSRTQIFNMISDYNNNMRRMIYLLENAEQRESRIMIDVMPLLSSSLSSLFDSSLSQLPTAQQINENTTRSNYVVLDISGNELPTCPITMETIQIGDPVLRINRCGHLFKEGALRTWLERDGRCPVCRGSV